MGSEFQREAGTFLGVPLLPTFSHWDKKYREEQVTRAAAVVEYWSGIFILPFLGLPLPFRTSYCGIICKGRISSPMKSAEAEERMQPQCKSSTGSCTTSLPGKQASAWAKGGKFRERERKVQPSYALRRALVCLGTHLSPPQT